MRSWARFSGLLAAACAGGALLAQETVPQTAPDQQTPPPAEAPQQPVEQPQPKKKTWAEELLDWFNDQIIERTTITGSRRIAYHDHTISGDREAFNLSNYYGFGDRSITDFGNIYVSGNNVLGVLNFNFNIQDDRFQDPQGEKFAVDYKRGLWDIHLGDTYGSLLNTNRLASFSKTLRGASVGYRSGGFQTKVIVSEVKGEPRTIALNGNNSPGPYFLQSSQIVRGSERVEVDGIPQVFGTDYTIDYDLGAISFVNRSTLEAKLIPPTSTIVVSYEVFGFGGQTGSLTAAGLSYDMGSAGRIGFTGMQQKTGASGGLSTRLEKFQGFGAAGTPYILQFTPMPGTPVVIRVDGVLQAEGVDYTFDPDNQSIFYFNRFIPFTSTVDVLYTPKPTATVDGDRQTWGIDYRLPLGERGRDGAVVYSRAYGELTNSPTPLSGMAESLEARWGRGPWEFIGSVRNVPDDFVSVETTGFNRNEKAADMRFNYTPNERVTYGLSHRNSSISQRVSQSDGTVVTVPTRFTSASASVRLTPGTEGRLPWTFEHIRNKSRNLQGETRIDTSTVSTSKTWGPASLRVGLSHQDAEGPATVNGTLTNRKIKLDTVELRGTYTPTLDLSMNLSTSFSYINAGDDTGQGRDIQFGARWAPNDRFSLTGNYTDSDAGEISTLGTLSGGYGLGYNGNGFSGGIGTSPLLGVSNLRRLSLTSQWQPWDRLSLNVGATSYETQGSVSSNTKTQSLFFSADFDWNDYSRVSGGISLDRTEYIQSDFRSNATNWYLAMDGAPPGRFSYSLTMSGLLTGGNSSFAQDSNAIDARANYLLGERHSLAFSYSTGAISGYYPQDTTDWALTYQYKIWESLALNISYRERDVFNRDPLLTSGQYSSKGFDIELAFNFGRW